MPQSQLSRRSVLIRAGIGAGVITTTGLILPEDAIARIDVRTLRPGDVLLVRRNRRDRPRWGYYRHAAVWDGQRIIEGGIGKTYTRVTSTDLRQFERRYQQIVVRRLRWSSNVYGPRLAREAYRRMGRRAYCSLLIQLAYNAALRQRVVWAKPDHIAAAPQFRTVFSLG